MPPIVVVPTGRWQSDPKELAAAFDAMVDSAALMVVESMHQSNSALWRRWWAAEQPTLRYFVTCLGADDFGRETYVVELLRLVTHLLEIQDVARG